MSWATKSFIETKRGLGDIGRVSGQRWLLSLHALCPALFQAGLTSLIFSSHLSPSCGTCGSRRSPACCGMVMVRKQEGHSSPGNWQQEPCHPFLGWPWKSPHGCYHLCHCWTCCLRLRRTSGRRARGTPSCGCARPMKIQRPASDTSHIRSWHCSVL